MSRSGSTVNERTFLETLIRPGPGDSDWVPRTNLPLLAILPAGKERIHVFVTWNSMQSTCRIERMLPRTAG